MWADGYSQCCASRARGRDPPPHVRAGAPHATDLQIIADILDPAPKPALIDPTAEVVNLVMRLCAGPGVDRVGGADKDAQ